MRLLANPVALRMFVVALASGFAFALGLALILRLRRRIAEEASLAVTRPSSETFPFETYQAVIQQLKQQEQELHRLRRAESDRASASENVSAALLANLTSGVLLFNPLGLVQQANPAARRILGFASPSGLHAREIFAGVSAVRQENGELDERGQSLARAVESALRQGETFRRLEANYVTPDGDERVLGITVSPVRDARGDSLGAACLISDLTEVTRLARAVRLRESLAALGEMAAGIAHEFKNSLAIISGYAQLLQTEADPEAAREFAGNIARETGNLNRIVTDFLDFARPQELKRDTIELRAMLEECAANCAVDLHCDQVPSSFSICGDATALRQAFSNLLRNSAEAARNGAPVEVRVKAEQDGEGTRIVLRDNGSGIARQHWSKIFIPFFTTKPQGTGLGLALVHRIVTEHGGSVAVASDESGTAFTLTFPAPERSPAAREDEVEHRRALPLAAEES